MGISKAQSAIYDEIKKTEAFLLRGDICVYEATQHLSRAINAASWDYVNGKGGRFDSIAAYHKAFEMLAKATKRK